MNHNCLNLSVIPQFRGTCWFNAILMISLYSQNVRKILIKVSKKWNKTNSFLMILKTILIKYYDNQPEKVQAFYNKFRPEIILFKLIKLIGDKEMINYWKQYNKNKFINNFPWSIDNFLTVFLKFLNIKVLDITYLNNKYYLNLEKEFIIKYDNKTNKLIKTLINPENYNNFEKRIKRVNEVKQETNKILKDIPDIVILKHQDLYKGIILKDYEKKANEPNFIVKGVNTYDNIIYINGHKYKLDAVIISNYNDTNDKHAIAGITCNNNKYVYNGWNSETKDNAMINKNKRKDISPCSLMQYNWDLKKDDGFCLNQITCKLDFFDTKLTKKDLCFSFAKGNRILVYVRIFDDDNKDDNKDDDDITDKINLSQVSDVIRDIHNIKDMTDVEIRKKLKIFDKKYNRSDLEKLYYQQIKKDFNFNSIVDMNTPIKNKNKSLTKIDLLNIIKAKNPLLKGLYKLKKEELKKLL